MGFWAACFCSGVSAWRAHLCDIVWLVCAPVSLFEEPVYGIWCSKFLSQCSFWMSTFMGFWAACFCSGVSAWRAHLCDIVWLVCDPVSLFEEPVYGIWCSKFLSQCSFWMSTFMGFWAACFCSGVSAWRAHLCDIVWLVCDPVSLFEEPVYGIWCSKFLSQCSFWMSTFMGFWVACFCSGVSAWRAHLCDIVWLVCDPVSLFEEPVYGIWCSKFLSQCSFWMSAFMGFWAACFCSGVSAWRAHLCDIVWLVCDPVSLFEEPVYGIWCSKFLSQCSFWMSTFMGFWVACFCSGVSAWRAHLCDIVWLVCDPVSLFEEPVYGIWCSKFLSQCSFWMSTFMWFGRHVSVLVSLLGEPIYVTLCGLFVTQCPCLKSQFTGSGVASFCLNVLFV